MPPTPGPLTVAGVRGLFATASAWLDRNAQAIDAINVYPVPDGDTGSNMAGTLRDTLAGLVSDFHLAGDVMGALARGALRSARGNSGVILSQMLRGYAEATAGVEHIDGPALARALAEGSRAAYGAIPDPVEGTILTVARVAAEAAEAAAIAGSADPLPVIEAALAGARTALAQTPDLLPVLKQAGVVDSGGFGLVVMLEGAAQYLRGEAAPPSAHDAGVIRRDYLAQIAAAHGSRAAAYGYCTEFSISGAGLELNELRGRLEEIARSVLVVGNAEMAHIHAHTSDPGAVIGLGTACGSITNVKVENMRAQHELLVAAAQLNAASRSPSVATVAVLAGDGFSEVALSLGVSKVVSGGATMNPSVEQMLEAIEAVPASAVIVLPNHKNVVLSAEQAAALSEKAVRVLPTLSAAQGIAALMSFSPEGTFDENLDAMAAAAARVHTIEVTRAARATRLGEFTAQEGQAIALVDGVLRVASESSDTAVLDALADLLPSPDGAITLYYGAEVTSEQTEALKTRLLRRYGLTWVLDVQAVRGGQPHYDYIVAIE